MLSLCTTEEKVVSFLDNLLVGTRKLLLTAHKASSSVG